MAGGGRLRVTVWNENVHERREESVRRNLPARPHRPIRFLRRLAFGGPLAWLHARRSHVRPAPVAEPPVSSG